MIQDLRREFNLQNVVIRNALPPYNVNGVSPERQGGDFTINQNFSEDKPVSFSSLGTPVFSNLQFLADEYTDNYGKVTSFQTITFDAVIMTVNQQKNIVTTQIQGRDGTVKEEIGMGDYTITINGIITGKNGHYPIDEVREFKKMLNANKALSVVSVYLQNLDVTNVVIKDYEFAQETGGYSYQRFSINALSDSLQEIFLLNA
jgi:hypothetical protein